MSEPTRMQIKVDIGQPNRPGPSRLVTLARVIEWIKKQELDEYTQNGLIEIAAGYPNTALPSFRRNFNLMLQRVRAKRRKEQIGDVNVKEQEVVSSARNSPTNLEDALNQAFKAVEDRKLKDGPEFTPVRRSLFDEPEEEVGQAEEPTEVEPEEWGEDEVGSIVTDGDGPTAE